MCLSSSWLLFLEFIKQASASMLELTALLEDIVRSLYYYPLHKALFLSINIPFSVLPIIAPVIHL